MLSIYLRRCLFPLSPQTFRFLLIVLRNGPNHSSPFHHYCPFSVYVVVFHSTSQYLMILVTPSFSISNGLTARQSLDTSSLPSACQSPCQVLNTMNVGPFLTSRACVTSTLSTFLSRVVLRMKAAYVPAASAPSCSNA